MPALRSVRFRLVMLAIATGLTGLGAGVWWFAGSDTTTHAAATCDQLPALTAQPYEPIRIGPVAFDPGPDLGAGSRLKWVGRDDRGYIVKSFLWFDRGDQPLVVTGLHESADRPLLFDYSASGYSDRAEIDPSPSGPGLAPQGASPGTIRGIPGALAAPALGPYRLTVRRADGQEWTKTIWICESANPPRDPSRSSAGGT